MAKFFNKYGKHLLSLTAVSTVLALPLAASAGGTILENMQTAAGSLASANPDLYQVIGLIIDIVLGILGVLLVLIIVWAGFLWMTSQGDTARVDKAKKMIYQAVIGLLIIFAAYAISAFVIMNLQSITGAAI
jgi:hypothetical protein